MTIEKPAVPLKLGPVTITCIEESTIPLFDPLDIFPDCTPEILAQESYWLDQPRYRDSSTGFLQLAMQSFLICYHGRNIIIDTCGGNCKNRVRPQFHQQNTPWLENLQAAGVERKDIDIVLSTHLHVDHIGWHSMLENGEWLPTFPKARYLFAQTEFDYFSGPEAVVIFERNGDYWSDSIQPVLDAGLAEFVTMDHRVDEYLTLVPTPGDTPGHVAIKIADGGKDLAIFTGDLFHHLLQIRYPQWSSRYAVAPDLARHHRLALFARYADTETCFFPAHFPSPTGGTIKTSQSGYHYVYVDGRDDLNTKGVLK